MEQQADGAADEELPEHLLYSILLLLPLKPLLRFCCVSKKWRDVIASRSFYLNRRPVLQSSSTVSNTAADEVVYCFLGGSKRKMLFSAAIHRIWGGDHDPQESLSVDVPFFSDGSGPHEDDFFYVSSLSCDGLLCVVYKGKGRLANRIIVWNPYARQCRSVSWPEEFEEDCFYESVFVGFGYDEVVSDYKVVVMKSPDSASGEWRIRVTALRSGSWRAVEQSSTSTLSLLPSSSVRMCGGFRPVAVEGDIYWMGKTRSDHARHILKFSLAEETLTTLPLPPEVSEKLRTQIPNAELEETGMSGRQRRVKLGHQQNKSLYLYHYNAYPGYMLGCAGVEVWVCSKPGRREEWTKVVSVSESGIHECVNGGIIRPLGFTAKGDFIMTCYNNNCLGAYIFEKDKLKILKTYDNLVCPKQSRICGVALVDRESSISP
uniref:F-box domain-containing protein n=1 Tax=Kalanchoe fedtschenkoi TaxID=63787 RepID=A0A7N0U3D1_KALFE